MNNIKHKFITNLSIYRIIKKIKKSNKSAYNIGYELSYISYILYILLDNNTDIIFDNIIIYNYLKNDNIFENLCIAKYFSKNILYYHFFKNFSIKLSKIKDNYLFTFIRGYYFNHNNLYSTNLNYSFLDYNYFVLYDFHTYFLSIIYKRLINNEYKNKIKFLLNYDADKYSIDDFINLCNYKLVFIHKQKYYNNSIKNLLHLLYKNNNQLYSREDEILYNIYSAYNITDINH